MSISRIHPNPPCGVLIITRNKSLMKSKNQTSIVMHTTTNKAKILHLKYEKMIRTRFFCYKKMNPSTTITK